MGISLSKWLSLLCAIYIYHPYIVEAKRPAQARRDKAWQEQKARCESEDCAHLITEEAFNCVNNCTSLSCYSQIYQEIPLEDGEIDFERSRLFTACLRREQQDLKSRKFANVMSNQ